MRKNVKRGGSKYPGKFESSGELGEYLHEITMDSGQDEELGDVQDFGWYGLFNGIKVPGIKKKVYAIVSEDSQGFWDVYEYNSSKEVMKAWDKLSHEYEEFMEEGEEY